MKKFDPKNLFEHYEKTKQEIFDHVGYVQNYRILPIVDDREYFWKLNGEGRGSTVTFAITKKALKQGLTEETGEYYQNEIYTQRFLEKWVYRGKDFTMIVVDTHCDLNQYLQIFDNAKEIK